MHGNAFDSHTRSLVYSIDANWGIWKGLALRGTFSVLQIMATEEDHTGDGDSRRHKERSIGIGDTPLLLQYLFQSRGQVPSPWSVGVGAGAYFPTGRGVADDFPSNSTFVSSTTDPLISLSAAYNLLPEFGLYCHGYSRIIVAEGKGGFRAGSSFLYGGGIRVRYFGSLALSIGVNVLHKLKDKQPEAHLAETDTGSHQDEGTGGNFVYLELGLNYLFTKGLLEGLSIQIATQLPVYQFVYGVQLVENFNFIFSIGYGFSVYAG